MACAPAPSWYSIADGDSLWIVNARRTTSVPLTDVHTLTWGRDGLTLYAVTGQDVLSLREIRRDNAAVSHEAPLGVGRTSSVTIDSRARTLYVAVGSKLRVFALTPLQPRYSTSVCVHDDARAIALFEPGTKVFVACGGGTVTEFDTELERVLRRAQLPGSCSPSTLFLSANQTIVFVACGQQGLVYLLDRVTLTALDSIDAGGAFREVVVEASRQHALVMRPSGSVESWDLRRNTRVPIELSGPAQSAATAGDGSVVIAPETGFPLSIVGPDGLRRTVDGPRLGSVRSLAVWPRATPVMRWLAHRSSPPFESTQPRGRQ